MIIEYNSIEYIKYIEKIESDITSAMNELLHRISF